MQVWSGCFDHKASLRTVHTMEQQQQQHLSTARRPSRGRALWHGSCMHAELQEPATQLLPASQRLYNERHGR